ncbi:hypothetical protein CWI37_0893p0010 [Hamiltosporidium tvaerminnensis]|uniref:Integrase catalytic domain-containing protein n=1 Tax=Hamiltosporidium tvaerminnensis TaxID=1176355 RepID=A0A4Q9L2T6_9MICR|nr:hypothetical protein CWI37_0893p0010 [Hamiltosporidium tvaerminnensis]
MKEYLNKQNIKQLLIPIYSPGSNGISERINKTISFMLSINKKKDIYEIVKEIENTINLNYNSSLKCSPYSIIQEYSIYNPLRRRVEYDCIQHNNIYPNRFKLALGDMVYVKKYLSTKLDKMYVGSKNGGGGVNIKYDNR